MKSWMNEKREMTSRVFSEKGAGSFGKGSDCEREAQNYKLIWMSSCKAENPSPRWKCAGASWGKGWRNRFLMVIEIPPMLHDTKSHNEGGKSFQWIIIGSHVNEHFHYKFFPIPIFYIFSCRFSFRGDWLMEQPPTLDGDNTNTTARSACKPIELPDFHSFNIPFRRFFASSRFA